MDKQVKSTNMLRIYDRLRQSPVTLDVLYEWVQRAGMDVSRRTLYRYLNGLATGIKFQGEKLVIYNNEFNKKVWKIEFDESSANLNQFDLNSYYILRNFISNSLSGPRQPSLTKLDELIYTLASKSRFQLNVDAHNMAFTRTNYFDARYTEQDHEIIEDMIWAIQHHRKVKVEEFNWDVRFLPQGFETGTLVLPLKLVFHFGLMYLCVYVESLEEICVLPLTDIIRISITNETFRPHLFYQQMAQYLDDTFGVIRNYDKEIYDVAIEFAGATGKYIKTMNWHTSQEFEDLPNGNVLLRLRCGLNRDLVGFVFYFLNNARVIAPVQLRELIVGKLQQTLSNYEDDSIFSYQTNLPQHTASGLVPM